MRSHVPATRSEPNADGGRGTMEEGAGRSNDDWFRDNLLDLVENYPNQWIAVLKGSVIASSSSRRRAQAEAKRIAGREEFSLYFIQPSMLQMGLGRGAGPPETRSP